ncbi:MAG: DUF1566 domain-containing protein [Nitrospirae bacterium]|nr:DUF1566 domain-containing protein [Nitrospirota bacterium]
MNLEKLDKLKENIFQSADSKLYIPLAEEYKKINMIDEAVKVLKYCIGKHPNYMSAHVALGKIYMEQGYLQKAIEEFETVVTAIPDNLLAHRKLAQLYQNRSLQSRGMTTGDTTRALASLEKILLLNPNDEDAQESIRKLLTQPYKEAKTEKISHDYQGHEEEVKTVEPQIEGTSSEPLLQQQLQAIDTYYDVFISYDRRDRGFADKLVSSLENRGIECWIDRVNIVPGVEWDEEIFKTITENPEICMVVLFSKNTLQSKRVAGEVRLADDNYLRIIPVFIEDIKLTGVFAIRLAGKHNIEAFNPDIDVAEKICVALKKQKPDLHIPPPPPPTRFVDNGDQTITDTSTDLMWTKDADLAGRKIWRDALDYVASMNKGMVENFGYTDWLLPDKEELERLVKNSKGAPWFWLKSQGFTNVQSYYYWSSTAYTNDTSLAWTIRMGDGNVSASARAYYVGYVWPVRSVH